MRLSRRQFLRDTACVGGIVTFGGRRASPQGRRPGEEREIGGIRLCWCPAGRFTMGSPASEAGRRTNEAQVEVALTRGFWAGKFEVTQAQWRRVMGRFPDKQPSEQFGLGDDVPAYWISYDEAEAFAAAATRDAVQTGSLPAGWQFSLPSEAQWEYACRAGTTSATAFGESLTLQQANFSLAAPVRGADATGRSRRAGSYPANAWGLHDMHGNVWEWCRDWFHTRLPGGTDPDLSTVRGVMNRDGTYSRVRRGGAWIESAAWCRSASRLLYEPDRRSDHIGFRVIVVERAPVDTQAEHRILFIGNSLTYVNDLPAMVQSLGSASKRKVMCQMVALPDFGLEEHWQHGEAVRAIRRGGWSLVVLQQGPSALPESQKILRDYVRRFDAEIRAIKARTALYMVWPSRSRQQDFPGVSASYTAAAHDVGALLFPVGDAWRAAWKRDPALALYSPDGLHPSREGTYLGALVIASRLLGVSPVGLPAEGIAPGTARLLQEVAASFHSTSSAMKMAP